MSNPYAIPGDNSFVLVEGFSAGYVTAPASLVYVHRLTLLQIYSWFKGDAVSFISSLMLLKECDACV